MSLYAELKRRNVLRVAIFYLAGSWLLIQVLETLFPIFRLDETSIQIVVIIVAIGIIPARYTSTRFPGKPLTPIAGAPMIQRVWDRACRAKHLSEVIVATDDERIAEVCESFGAPVVMTSSDHPTGTDRLAEVARSLDTDIVVNIQGDEPTIEGFVIDAAVEALVEAEDAPMSTVIHSAEPSASEDPNRVKVVIDRQGYALRPRGRSGYARVRIP